MTLMKSLLKLQHRSFPRDNTRGATAIAGLRHIPAESLHNSKPTWWLHSRFHFSFADYFNPDNLNFGALRVLNDDLVKPRAGFGRHPHRDAEIFSYIVDGELTHEDSMGNKEALGRGAVQYLSAGSGIRHSEMNEHPTETCRFLQVWLTPDKQGYEPQYGSSQYQRKHRHNQLLHILSGTGAAPKWSDIYCTGHSVKLHQDCNVFVSESDPERRFEVPLASGRQAYLVCIEGSMRVNDCKLVTRDAVELTASQDVMPVTLQMSDQGAHFMLIEMKHEQGQAM